MNAVKMTCFAAAADGDLSRLVLLAGVVFELCRMAFCSSGVPVTEVYLVSPRLDGCDGCVLDVLRRIEVRLADRQVQDPAALGLELPHTGGRGNAGRGFDTGYA